MLIYLRVIAILIAVSTTSSTKDKPSSSFSMFREVENKCAAYTNHIVQPMFEYIEKAKNEITTKDKEIAALKRNIIELNEEFGNSKLELASIKDKLESSKTQILSINIAYQNLQKKLIEEKQQQKQPVNCIGFDYYPRIVELQVEGLKSFLVSCESNVAGPGWTIIQRRINGEIDFFRNWTEYKEGFGSARSEYWIGLERLYRMTNAQRYELYIQLVDQNNETRYAKYDNFLIGSEAKKYKLISIGGYNGTAGDSMSYHVGCTFSTNDEDNDYYSFGNCANALKGAWWYHSCAFSNLNGKRFDCNIENSNELENTGCIYWENWHGRSHSLKRVQMMIRPLKLC